MIAASPWPTSRNVARSRPRGAPERRASSSSTIRAAAASVRKAARDLALNATAAIATARTTSCHDVGCGTCAVAAGIANTRAMTRTSESAPDATMAHPRSAAGHAGTSAWTRHSGSATDSPRGTASKFASTPPTGKVGAKRARIGTQGIDAAIVVATARAAGWTREGTRDASRSPRGDANASSPAVAPADSAKDRSNAIERIGHGHGAHREPERPRRVRSSSESARREAGGRHPRRTQGGPARSGQLRVEPRDRNPDGGSQPPDVDLRRDPLDARETSLEHTDRHGEDEHQMHPRHGEEVRETARAKASIVVRVQVALAEDERSRHRRDVGRERRVDAGPYPRARPIDPRKKADGAVCHPYVERPARANDVPERLGRAGVAARAVPEPLRGRQRGDDLDIVATRQVLGSAVERRAPLPRDRRPLAHQAGEARIPPERTADAHGGRVDATPRATTRWLPEDAVGARSGFRVPVHGCVGASDAEAHRERQDRGGAEPCATVTERDGENQGRRKGHLGRRHRREAPGRERDACDEDKVDRLL